MNKQIWRIVGLGWLGEALAASLRADGATVQGTHQETFRFETDEFPLGDADVVFLNTPPLTAMAPTDYVAKVRAAAETRVLFVSSTSVYGDAPGHFTEASPPKPTAAGARWLTEVENHLRTKFQTRLSVIRPGGLIGGNRHPVKFMAGRANAGPDGVINFIHREDLVEILKTVAAKASLPLINAVAPHHPRKSKYYAAWAKMLALEAPRFDAKTLIERVIDSEVLSSLYTDWRVPLLDRF